MLLAVHTLFLSLSQYLNEREVNEAKRKSTCKKEKNKKERMKSHEGTIMNENFIKRKWMWKFNELEQMKE